PIAFERADQNAYPMDREIKMHYRGQYTQIKNKLSRENPQHNNDIAIYLIAQGDGDAMDGVRVIMQSDAVRQMKSPEEKERYIQGVIGFTHSYQDALQQGMSTKLFEHRLFLLQHKTQPTQTGTLEEELEM
ncbi:hypothetical protein ACSYAD_32315, partial [Acaryochloris marina NIES-2412]|uniref:hypothetical protein n=1 Tax=Acaryochloris marina TaxID=155978 RepID=UPI004059C656